MAHYYLRRLGQAVLTVFTVIVTSFVLIKNMPGGPVDYLIAQLADSRDRSMSTEVVREMSVEYLLVDPSDPIWVQFADYFLSVLQGDFGQSFWYQRPVNELIAEALPWTIFYAVIALVFSFGIGIVLGSLMGYFEGTRFDAVTTLVSQTIVAVPYYIIALVLVMVFAFNLEMFPTGGNKAIGVGAGLSLEFLTSILHHATLPIASLVIARFGFTALSMRGNSVRVLGSDYLRVARLRGLNERRIALLYVGRNAILPLWTGLMIAIGTLFGGSVILEKIFSYPGIGWYILQALNARDLPLLMGAFIVVTMAIVVGLLIADLTYGLIDPRVKQGGDQHEAY